MNNKKLIAMLTLLCFMFTLMPVAAFAEDDAGTPATPTRTEALDLTAQNIPSAENEGWAWDSASKTLTLDGLNLVTTATPAITVPAGTTIILADGSVNSITTSDSSGRGIECAGSLTLKTADDAAAKGTLNITTSASGRGIIYRIDRTEVPTAADVTFDFSSVILNINAQRGIENTFDPKSITDGSSGNHLAITMTNVEFTHTTTNDNRVISLYNKKGSSTLTVENSQFSGVGEIYVYGADNNSKATVDITGSTINITGGIYAQYAQNINAINIENSTVNAKLIKSGGWSQSCESASLNVSNSTLILGPAATTDGAIEVGGNHATEATATFKNSNIIAVNDGKTQNNELKGSAISVSQVPGTGQNNDTARGTLTMENCEFLAMGVKDFTHAEVDNHQHGNHITCVVLPDGMTVEPDEKDATILKVSIKDNLNNNNTITSGGVTYTVKTVGEGSSTLNTATEVLTLPAGTTLGIKDTDITISSEGSLTFEPGHVVTMPAGEETTVTLSDGNSGITTVTITPEKAAPLYIDENGNIEIPEGATVKVNGTEINNEGTGDSNLALNGNLTKKEDSTTTLPDDFTVTYGDQIILTATVESSPKQRAIAHDIVGFYCGDTLLYRVPVSYNDTKTSGTATLVYDTTENGLKIGENIIRADYGGSMNLNGSESDTISITLLAKELANDDTFTLDGVVITGPATVDADENGKVVVTVNTGGKIGTAVVPEGVEVTVPADKLDEVTTTGENAIVLPEGSTITSNGTTVAVVNGNVTVKADGSIIVPDNSEIKIGNTIITGPASVGVEGNVTVDAGGKIGTAVIPEGVKVTVPGNNLSEVKTNNEGAITLPAGSTVDKNGEVKELVYGGSIAADGTVTENAAPAKPNTGSGGFSGTYNYPVSLGTVDGAKVTFSDNNAVAGETVTITVTPDSGKQVDEVIVTDADGDVITVTKVGDNQYSFTMPAGKVNVAVTTKAISYNNKIVLQIGNQNIVVDGKATRNDVAPVIQGDRTLVPIRVIVEALGGDVDWNEATRTVTITIDGKVLTLVIDEMIPGFGQGATIMDSRTYVPIRYVAEYIGANVEWIEATQQIVILK